MYHCSISPGSIPGIVIYILPQGGTMGWLEILTNMHTYDKIINSHALTGVSQMINK